MSPTFLQRQKLGSRYRRSLVQVPTQPKQLKNRYPLGIGFLWLREEDSNLGFAPSVYFS